MRKSYVHRSIPRARKPMDTKFQLSERSRSRENRDERSFWFLNFMHSWACFHARKPCEAMKSKSSLITIVSFWFRGFTCFCCMKTGSWVHEIKKSKSSFITIVSWSTAFWELKLGTHRFSTTRNRSMDIVFMHHVIFVLAGNQKFEFWIENMRNFLRMFRSF